MGKLCSSSTAGSFAVNIRPLPEASFCPCQSGKPYAKCCGPYHRGAAAPTAEALMRSRYSAFALGLEDYVLSTWEPRYRPEGAEIDPEIQWRRLVILDTEDFGDTATVEFRAHWRNKMERGIMHERSSFVREDGRWFYTIGVQL
ncbi:MAG: YchJ family protein [Ancrocorticia populi]|uniref:UPF0225 protein DD236_07155 n=1 Tax=Ancrocorticia populi TaxID=2175228 RepID=A0A2V1K8Y1_9ACTO|nr:YchJ family metal-binding protein [Ancrocorticia populi]PWF25884.1 hypothetical protein DD236_07155 [Ancrocorticia populi]